ncbi:MAG: hypothetical protein ACI3ZC_03185 [Candidatus Cryptobacteroides sp.]
MNIKKTLAFALCCTFASALFAQGLQGRPENGMKDKPSGRTPESIAKQKVDRMDSRLDLSDKQEKQLYKFFCKQEKKVRKASESAQNPGGEGMRPHEGGMEGGRPPMGGHGRPGGGPGMGGGRPEMGRPQGERPQGERPQGDRTQGGRPDGGRPEGDGFRPGEIPQGYEQMVKNEEDAAKKLKKVLTADQYSRWEEIQKQKK